MCHICIIIYVCVIYIYIYIHTHIGPSCCRVPAAFRRRRLGLFLRTAQKMLIGICYYVYIHTYIHTYMHTYAHIHIVVYTHRKWEPRYPAHGKRPCECNRGCGQFKVQRFKLRVSNARTVARLDLDVPSDNSGPRARSTFPD